MKILQVIHSVDPRGGGPIEGVRQLGAALNAHGISTEVMSFDAPGSSGTRDFPFPLHPTGPSHFGYGYNSQAVPWLKQNRTKYDAVIVNGVLAVCQLCRVARPSSHFDALLCLSAWDARSLVQASISAEAS